LSPCACAGFGDFDPAAHEAEVQALVLRHRDQIDTWFHPCSRERHHDLAAMYVADTCITRNLDRIATGFASYLSEVILAS